MHTPPPIQTVQVRRFKNQALFYLNNQPFFLMEAGILHATEEEEHDSRVRDEVIQRARLLGLNTIEIGVDWSYLEQEHSFDALFTRIDTLIHRIASAGCYASLRIRAEYRPAWYPASWITDCRNREDKPYITFHGADFILRASSFMRRIARHYHEHPSILYMTCGFGCEGMNRYPGRHLGWTDFSEEAKQAFRLYLRRTYRDDIRVLNQCWKSHFPDFERIDPPAQGHDSESSPPLLEFKRFRMQTLGKVSSTLLDAVKQEVPNRPVGTFIEGGASYPSNPRGSNPPAWYSQIEFSKIPNNYFEKMESVRSQRHTTSGFLNEKVLINELTTGETSTSQGATFAILETLQQPSYPSFIFLQFLCPSTLKKLPPLLTYIRDHFQDFWGRDPEIALLDNTYGANLGTTTDPILHSEHDHLACNLMKRGICFDTLYPEQLETTLQAERYKLLIVSPVHMLTPQSLGLLADYRGNTPIICCGRDDSLPSLVVEVRRLTAHSFTSLRDRLGFPLTEIPDLPDSVQPGSKALLHGCFYTHPDRMEVLDIVLDRLGVRSIHLPGLEGTFVHHDFYVGRVYSDLHLTKPLHCRCVQPPRHGLIVRAGDLSLQHIELRWDVLSGHHRQTTLPEPIGKHDLVLFFNPRNKHV